MDNAPALARVLVVEDSPTQAESLMDLLMGAGFDVTLADNGGRALECFRARRFDLVLIDVVLPDVNGYEVSKLLKEIDEDVSIVMLTSLRDPVEILRALAAGADNFLLKPFVPTELVARIETLLYHRAMRCSGRANMGLAVVLAGERFMITPERQQILDLLMSSFEGLVDLNRQLRARQDAIVGAYAQLRREFAALERERSLDTVIVGA